LRCVAVCCSVLQRVAVCCSVLQCVAVCCSVLQCVPNGAQSCVMSCVCMGWLRWVGCFKIQVSLQNTGLFCRALLQKRPIFLSILLIVATPYQMALKHTHIKHDGAEVHTHKFSAINTHRIPTSAPSCRTEFLPLCSLSHAYNILMHTIF